MEYIKKKQYANKEIFNEVIKKIWKLYPVVKYQYKYF